MGDDLIYLIAVTSKKKKSFLFSQDTKGFFLIQEQSFL